MEEWETADDGVVYLDRTDLERGSAAPFVAVYDDGAATTRYGWFCTNCESLETAMDAMGRIKCTDCGNFRKATEWDAAHE